MDKTYGARALWNQVSSVRFRDGGGVGREVETVCRSGGVGDLGWADGRWESLAGKGQEVELSRFSRQRSDFPSEWS